MNQNSVILEFRPGPGGEEAKIWASDLKRMYLRYVGYLNFKSEEIADNTVRIRGESVFGIFQYEAGTHRVQRIPATERAGRIHTSTATVAVLPDITETEVAVKNEDLEWDFFRSGGKGGQNVNKVSSAVRLRHKPSGLTVSCQSERDQYQNRQAALSLLRAKLWEQEELKAAKTLGAARTVIGRGMRAEKIRTYNYPQNRVTDHRIDKSWHNLDDIVNGKLEKISQALRQAEFK
jgi:peptide chain release factor 1